MIEQFDFYGHSIRVASPDSNVAEEIRRDFAYFRVPAGEGPANVNVEANLVPPPYMNLPPAPMTVITPRNVCFQSGKITYIDYFGKGLAEFDRERMRCVVFSSDGDLLHEIVYLFILSTVGKHLDSRGLHRIHALGVSYHSKGILLLLPSGGGKSTMALELLNRPGFLLLSEDTPLIDRRGRILPFPLRLGIRPDQRTGIPSAYLRTVRRMEFDPKTLVDIEYFQDRLAESAIPDTILVGERNLGDVSKIVALGRRHAFKALMKYMVVGLGVYQGLEFLLERGVGELAGKTGVVASRLYNSLHLLLRARAFKFVLGRDPLKNCQTLIQFIEDNSV